ncbi:uroporphyrinogen-III C-methyltransferase [Ramlibacter tataouinensis]|uniref:uroporphyrinogen-III C-methyltransferase n=1 Tax=Ramlibacter tataouinensis TaxID=94132 RepID=UPI0022F3A93C|nr:uroporphyrinogen-III C-methyltransferase [Ramlibacter tataouinensis]WBY03169.1 uroporphyrinogen-III C-methyltransferase [Ramlibacter tataouinensis]
MTFERDAVVAPLGRAAAAGRPGKVWLVGAGPGDADLLTLKAARLLSRARVVLYDHLVGEDVMALLPAQARRICVGKRNRNHSLPQEETNALLVRLAGEGLDVVRLKGGDPYVFGRGAEEAMALAQAGIPFEVVPGITSAQGMAAYAGIPLTHRGLASSVVFATGHCRDGGEEPDWAALARPNQTAVIYMGLARLDTICRELMAHGLPPATPAALVEQATAPRQRVIEGALGGLPALAAQHRVAAPALIVVGDVVRLHGELGWFAPAPPARARETQFA